MGGWGGTAPPAGLLSPRVPALSAPLAWTPFPAGFLCLWTQRSPAPRGFPCPSSVNERQLSAPASPTRLPRFLSTLLSSALQSACIYSVYCFFLQHVEGFCGCCSQHLTHCQESDLTQRLNSIKNPSVGETPLSPALDCEPLGGRTKAESCLEGTLHSGAIPTPHPINMLAPRPSHIPKSSSSLGWGWGSPPEDCLSHDPLGWQRTWHSPCLPRELRHPGNSLC